MRLLVFGAAQVVQGAPEPGGHKAAGGDGRLCTRIPGTFGQLAGKHADQDQSCWWVDVNPASLYSNLADVCTVHAHVFAAPQRRKHDLNNMAESQ